METLPTLYVMQNQTNNPRNGDARAQITHTANEVCTTQDSRVEHLIR